MSTSSTTPGVAGPAGATGATGATGPTGPQPSLGSTPSTQAYSDAAAGGSDVTASKNDHKHGFPAASSVINWKEALYNQVATSETTTSAPFVDLATVGPTVTTGSAVSGDRAQVWGLCGSSNDTINQGNYFAPKNDATATALNDGGNFRKDVTAGDTLGMQALMTFTLTAGAVRTIKLQYGTDGGTATFIRRWMTVNRINP